MQTFFEHFYSQSKTEKSQVDKITFSRIPKLAKIPKSISKIAFLVPNCLKRGDFSTDRHLILKSSFFSSPISEWFPREINNMTNNGFKTQKIEVKILFIHFPRSEKMALSDFIILIKVWNWIHTFRSKLKIIKLWKLMLLDITPTKFSV